MFEPRATGPEPTDEQRRVLDEEFYASDPTAHLRARIYTLLSADRAAPVRDDLRQRLHALGLTPEALEWLRPDDTTQQEMLAVEAFALRHQCAETLVRLVTGAMRTLGTPSPRTLWEELEDGALRTGEEIDTIEHALQHAGLDGRVLSTPDQMREAEHTGAWPVHLGRAWQWVEHAIDLLRSEGLDLTAGHNKLKHGFAVRARSDALTHLLQAAAVPDPRAIPASALKTSVPLIDGTELQFLKREHPGGRKQGRSWLSRTTLNLEPATVLAEALTLTVIHGLVFTAAAARFHEARGEQPPPTVTPNGLPDPGRFVLEVRGVRVPVTLPASGPAPQVMLQHHAVTVGITVGERIQGTVIADPAEDDSTDASPPSP